MSAPLTRRTLLGTAGAAAAVLGVPLPLRAQPRAIKIGVITPVTGAMAEVGQYCRIAAQMAADDVNAAGGIKSMGGARLELLLGDSETKMEVARSEADRVIGAGAQLLTGAFHSAHVAAISSLAQQKRVPYIIDISGADAPTANIARSVREGTQKVQYVYRIFPSGLIFARNCVRYMTEMFKQAGASPKRIVLMYSNDAFGKPQAEHFLNVHKAANPGFDVVDVIPYPETATDLSTEVTRARVARPDIIAPVTRPATAIILLEELARQRVDVMGIISPGAPGLYESRQIEQLRQNLEYVMDNVPWPNFRDPQTQRLAQEFLKRSNGKAFDTSGYTYEAIRVIADVLERARSADPDALVDAIKKTSYTSHLMVANGPIRFDEGGDNPNAGTAMIQILKQRPRIVWPADAAEEKFVFPRPKR